MSKRCGWRDHRVDPVCGGGRLQQGLRDLCVRLQHLGQILKAMRERGRVFRKGLSAQGFFLKRTWVQFLRSFSIQRFYGHQPFKYIPYLGHPLWAQHDLSPLLGSLTNWGAPIPLEEGHSLSVTCSPGVPEGVTLIGGSLVNPEKWGCLFPHQRDCVTWWEEHCPRGLVGLTYSPCLADCWIRGTGKWLTLHFLIHPMRKRIQPH